MRTAFLIFALCLSTMLRAQTPQLVYDIQPGTTGSAPTLFTDFNNKLYFIAYDTIHGNELWSYDGVNSPSLVYDLNPGIGSGAYTTPSAQLGILNGKLYFCGSDGTTGFELYVYDGSNPPKLAADIEAGSKDSYPWWFTTIGNKLLFSASTTANGAELYSYDGINPPLLVDINPGSGHSGPLNFIAYNSQLYFAASYPPPGIKLHVYDPVAGTQQLVSDFASTTTNYIGPYVSVTAYGKLYFSVISNGFGRELCSYDGSSVTRLTDLAPGTADGVQPTGFNVSWANLAGFKNAIYFSGSTDGTKFQLYRYDLSSGATSLAKTINPSGGAEIGVLTVYNGNLYFMASTDNSSMKLWKSDGVSTNPIADIGPGIPTSGPARMFVWKNRLYFAASESQNGYELYCLYDASGIQAVSFDGMVKAYPNPCQDHASIEITLTKPETLSISLCDALGKSVWSSGGTAFASGKTKMLIPTEHLSAGNYFYQINNASGQLLLSGQLTKR